MWNGPKAKQSLAGAFLGNIGEWRSQRTWVVARESRVSLTVPLARTAPVWLAGFDFPQMLLLCSCGRMPPQALSHPNKLEGKHGWAA